MFVKTLDKHVVLQNKILKYYNLKNGTHKVKPTEHGEKLPDGQINFDFYDAHISFLTSTEFSIDIRGAPRSFDFKARTQIEARAWYKEIKRHILASQGKKHRLSAQ